MTTTLSELTQKILNGYRLKRGDDLELFKTCDLDELEKGAGAIQKQYRHNHAPSSTGGAAAVPKTVNIAPNPPATAPMSKSTDSCR